MRTFNADNIGKPQFTHDCDSCKFIGHFTINGERFDVWFHERETAAYSANRPMTVAEFKAQIATEAQPVEVA